MSYFTNCAAKLEGNREGGLLLNKYWLPTLDTLRNLFYAPTVEMKITFELLRQGSLAV